MQNLNYIDEDIEAVNQFAAQKPQVDSRHSSSATLNCDYSENDLNQLLMSAEVSPGRVGYQEESPDSRGKRVASATNEHGSTDKYSQLTRLQEDEENVDFMQMFQQYQLQQRNQGPRMKGRGQMSGSADLSADARHPYTSEPQNN